MPSAAGALRGDGDVPKVHVDLARADVPVHAVKTVGALARRGHRVPAPRLDDDVALDGRVLACVHHVHAVGRLALGGDTDAAQHVDFDVADDIPVEVKVLLGPDTERLNTHRADGDVLEVE